MAAPLWFRGLRSRPLVNTLLLLLATLAVATAVLGPLLIRAVQQYTLRSGVAAASVGQTSVAVSQTLDVDSPDLLADYRGAMRSLDGVLGDARIRAGSTAWRPSVVDAVSVSNLAWAGADPKGEFSSRVNAGADCTTAYVLTAGRCPVTKGEVLVSRTDAERTRTALGGRLTFTQLASGPRRLRVVGTYDAPASDHGQLLRPGTPAGELVRVTAEPLVVQPEQAAALGLPATVTAQMSVAPDVTADEVPGLRATITEVKTRVGLLTEPVGFDSGLPALLDRIERQARAAALLMGVTVVQAVLLALFATAVVLQRLARTRAPEWGIGRLRGVPRRRWLASVYVEPALVLLAGLPLGYALGVAVARAATSRHLAPDTPVEPFRWPVLGVAALTALGALAALVAVSLRSVRRPLPELITQATEPRRMTVLGAMAQTTVVLLAGASLYQLLAGGALARESSLLGLLAPALFALALAVLAVRVMVLVVRAVTARPPRSRGALVVGRQTARTPSSLNPALVIAAGMALAVVAGQVVVLTQRNADLRAGAIVGADQVLSVAVPPGTDLVGAVRQADPSGQWAMAAQEQDGAGTARIVAVDSSRLERVAAWSPQWADAPELAAALHRASSPPLLLRGRTLTLTVDQVKLRFIGDDRVDVFTGAGGRVPPHLQVTVDTGARWQTLDLGPLRPDEATTRRMSLPCVTPCRLVHLGLRQSIPTPYTASFTVTAMATDEQPAEDLAPWLAESKRWREVVGGQVSLDPTSVAAALAGPDGLELRLIDYAGGQATLVAPADTDDPMPVLLAPTVLVAPFPGQPDVVAGSALNGQGQLLRVVGRATVLPRSLRDGVLADLVNARGLVDPASVKAVPQVWLRAGAPPEVEQRLVEQGLRIQQRETRAERAAELRREAVPRAAVLSVWIGALALLLSVVALAAARIADAGRRRRDWLALREAGLSTRVLGRLAFAEVVLPALFGAAIGLLAGLGATWLAADRLPVTDLEAPGPPLDLHLEWLPAAVLGGAIAVLIVLVAAFGAAVETRRERRR